MTEFYHPEQPSDEPDFYNGLPIPDAAATPLPVEATIAATRDEVRASASRLVLQGMLADAGYDYNPLSSPEA